MNNSNMENLLKLKGDLETKDADAAEAAKANFAANDTLTEEEKERLARMERETSVVVSDRDEMGNTVDTTIEEYVKSMDEKVAVIGTGKPHIDLEKADNIIKMMNSGDIKQTAESMKKEAQNRALEAFRALSTGTEEISDDDYLAINDSALAALQAHFNMDRLDSDTLISKLGKMSLREICDILPAEFVKIYTSENEVKFNNIKAKERLLTSLGYLTVTGPEMDYLNDYIEEENKLALVSKQLLQCQVDFSEMIQDPRNMAQIVTDTLAICPQDTSIWAKYIKMPNLVHNEFAQRVVIQQNYMDAYTKIMDKYPVISLMDSIDNPERLKEAAYNEKARHIIQTEIDEAKNKIDAYTKVTELALLKELWPLIPERFKTNKKVTMDYIMKEAVAAVDRIKRCKLNLNFPGFQGTERNAEQIFQHYTVAYANMIKNYNAAIVSVLEKETEEHTDIKPIAIENYDDAVVRTVFVTLLVILMGRVVKRLTKNDATKYDAIMLDAYFQIFCRAGMDIYIMEELWDMMRDFTKYVIDTWYIPAQNKSKKGHK